jgi:flagellar FliJ protein
LKRFRFNLQALLDARQRVENHARREVATLERVRRRLEEDLRQRQVRLGACKASVRAELVGSVNAKVLRIQANASLSLMRDAQRSVLELAGIHRQLEAARTTLVGRAAARRAIERLREQRLAAWKVQEKRRDQAVMDELSIQRTGSSKSKLEALGTP